jgi:hypothetical protein
MHYERQQALRFRRTFRHGHGGLLWTLRNN